MIINFLALQIHFKSIIAFYLHLTITCLDLRGAFYIKKKMARYRLYRYIHLRNNYTARVGEKEKEKEGEKKRERD